MFRRRPPLPPPDVSPPLSQPPAPELEPISLEFTPEELSGAEDPVAQPPPDETLESGAEYRAAGQPSQLAGAAGSLRSGEQARRTRRSARRAHFRRFWRWWLLGAAALCLGLVAASWFALPVRQVTVSGNKVLGAAQVKALAGAVPGRGWLYYGPKQAGGLLQNPWVASAQIIKHFPDALEIRVTERQPALRLLGRGGERLVSQDGKVLPLAKGFGKLPSVSGWGPARLGDAVLVTRALSRYTVQSVTYTPSGLTVKTAAGTVWSGDLKSLVKYAGSISMYPNKTVHIYPWGVSVQQ